MAPTPVLTVQPATKTRHLRGEHWEITQPQMTWWSNGTLEAKHILLAASGDLPKIKRLTFDQPSLAAGLVHVWQLHDGPAIVEGFNAPEIASDCAKSLNKYRAEVDEGAITTEPADAHDEELLRSVIRRVEGDPSLSVRTWTSAGASETGPSSSKLVYGTGDGSRVFYCDALKLALTARYVQDTEIDVWTIDVNSAWPALDPVAHAQYHQLTAGISQLIHEDIAALATNWTDGVQATKDLQMGPLDLGFHLSEGTLMELDDLAHRSAGFRVGQVFRGAVASMMPSNVED